MSDEKNIRNLFQDMQELELPNGYDQRFHEKIDRHGQKKSLSDWLSFFNRSTQVGLGLSLGALAVAVWSVVKVKNENKVSEVAINDEIDMLEDLDVLEQWDEEEIV